MAPIADLGAVKFSAYATDGTKTVRSRKLDLRIDLGILPVGAIINKVDRKILGDTGIMGGIHSFVISDGSFDFIFIVTNDIVAF